MKYLEMHNKPKAPVHLEHKLTGPKKKMKKKKMKISADLTVYLVTL